MWKNKFRRNMRANGGFIRIEFESARLHDRNFTGQKLTKKWTNLNRYTVSR